MPLEIACFTAESAILAARAGADRLELCRDRSTGGLTPDLNVVKRVIHDLGKDRPPVYVMIRISPSMDFMATEEEIERMVQQIKSLKPFVQGFVFGLLTSDTSVDEPGNTRLLAAASALPCTFHRAIDHSACPLASLERIISLGFTSVLTSGTALTALGGTPTIHRMVQLAAGRIEIIPGGGIRSGDIVSICERTGVAWVHSSGITGKGEDAEVDVEEVKLLKRAVWAGRERPQ